MDKPTKPPPGHENTMRVLRQAFAVPKAEMDRREAEWRAAHEDKPKRGPKPKKKP
jgi:hypothetical protein